MHATTKNLELTAEQLPERIAVGFSDLAEGAVPGDRGLFLTGHSPRAEILVVNVFELIRNAVLLAEVHSDRGTEDIIVTVGLHYTGKWLVSKALVTDILPCAIHGALEYAASFIHISTKLEQPGMNSFQKTMVLVIEINDDGQDYARPSNDSALAATSRGQESVSDKKGGLLNGPLLQIRVPLDMSVALHEIPELVLAATFGN